MERNEYFELISLYLDNRLEPEKRAKFEERLKTDSSLRAELAAQRRIKNYLQHLPKVEILNDNFKKHLLHRVEREVIPPRRNYRLNYATVTLALVFCSFMLGGAAFAVRWGLDEIKQSERLVVQVGTASVPAAVDHLNQSNLALASSAKEHIKFDVVGISPEEFFSNVLVSYQQGEIMHDLVAPFFLQTSIFEGATTNPPDSNILNGKSGWVKFSGSLPTEVHVIIAKSLEPQFRDFINRQEGVVPAPVATDRSGDVSQEETQYIWVDMRFMSFKETATDSVSGE